MIRWKNKLNDFGTATTLVIGLLIVSLALNPFLASKSLLGAASAQISARMAIYGGAEKIPIATSPRAAITGTKSGNGPLVYKHYEVTVDIQKGGGLGSKPGNPGGKKELEEHREPYRRKDY